MRPEPHEDPYAMHLTPFDLDAEMRRLMRIPEGVARDAVAEKLYTSNQIERNAANYLVDTFNVIYLEDCVPAVVDTGKTYVLQDGRTVTVEPGQNVTSDGDIVLSRNLTIPEAWNALKRGMFGSGGPDAEGATTADSTGFDLDAELRLLERIPAGVAREAIAELRSSADTIDQNAAIFIAETFNVFYREWCTDVTPEIRGPTGQAPSEKVYRLPDGRTVSLAPGQHVTPDGDIILSETLSVPEAKYELLRAVRG